MEARAGRRRPVHGRARHRRAGSVRVPAAFCGLVGVKPTRGLVSFGPELGNPYYTTTVDGILSRSVRDAAALLDVFVGQTRRRRVAGSCVVRLSGPLDDPGPLRVAVTTTSPFGEVEAEVRRRRGRRRMLESLGTKSDAAARTRSSWPPPDP